MNSRGFAIPLVYRVEGYPIPITEGYARRIMGI